MNKVRWGIIGAGRIAHSFARDMQYAENAELVAVGARNGDSAAEFARQYAIEKSFTGYQALMRCEDVDAVYIATPHNFHCAQTIDALNAGKAVLCEKPLVISAVECTEVTALSRDKGVYLVEGMWTWFLPAIQQAKQWVDEGRIGRVRHIKADFGYPIPFSNSGREYDIRLAGGCLLDMGIYPIAIAQYFLGREPDELSVHSHLAPNGVDDDVVIVADYGRDAIATLATSFRCKLQNWAYIIGEEGYIAIPDFWRADRCSLYQLDECIDSFSDGRKGLGFEYEISAVSADILAGKKQSDVVTPEVSMAFQRVMERVKSQFSQR